jgi:uncharacterized protein (UPF0332 family)
MTLTADERRAIALLRMENARQTLADARLLHERGSVRSAVNRTYYAMFYAASALAIARGKVFAKHSGVITFIHKECVQPGLLDRKYGRAFQKAFEDRSEGDYQDLLKLTDEQAADAIESAEEFVSALKALVESEKPSSSGHSQA